MMRLCRGRRKAWNVSWNLSRLGGKRPKNYTKLVFDLNAKQAAITGYVQNASHIGQRTH
jgi:hypothetical protein